jgi:hypothetical protein
VKGTVLTIQLSCRGKAGAACAGGLALTAIETIKHGKVIAIAPGAGAKKSATKRLVTLGVTSIAIAGGQSKTVTIALNAVGKLLLKHFHAIRLMLVVVQQSLGKTITVTSATVVFHQGSAHRKT